MIMFDLYCDNLFLYYFNFRCFLQLHVRDNFEVYIHEYHFKSYYRVYLVIYLIAQHPLKIDQITLDLPLFDNNYRRYTGEEL